MGEIEKSIKNMLKLALKSQIHGPTINNNDDPSRCLNKILRVKYEYHDQTRALSLSRPVKFDELRQKISSSLEISGGIILHYINPNKEIFGQISNQTELEQITQCVDRNTKYRSLRILVTTTMPQSSMSKSFSNDSNTKICIKRPDSPPPGSLNPNDIHMERSASLSTSHIDGEFIPEHDVPSDSHSGDSSYSSLLDSNWGGSGRRQKLPNLRSELSNLDKIAFPPKLGTYPIRINPSQYTKSEGKLTLPNKISSKLNSNLSREFNNTKSSSTNLSSVAKIKAPSLIDYRKGPLLGRGAFGQVFKCLDYQTGREFAMKEVSIPASNCYNSEAINKDAQCLENEINIYRGLACHQRIVQYFGMKREPRAMYIFMEYMAGGSVKDQLRQYGPLPHSIVGRYCKQILQGLAFLHQKLIIHRDVKAANILRDINGNVKLSDFGASRYLKSISVHRGDAHRSDDLHSTKNNRNNQIENSMANSFCGTFFWMAPEVIRGEPYSISADIWSMGSTTVEMLTGNPPYHDMEPYAALFKIATTNTIEFQSLIPLSKDMKLFVDQMFISNATERATAESLLRCDLLSQISAD